MHISRGRTLSATQRYVATLIVPLIMMMLGIPLLLRGFPHNGIYGVVSPYTMSSDEASYAISGIALFIAGLVWFILGLVLRQVLPLDPRPYRLVVWTGSAGLAVCIAAGFLLAYRK